MLICCGEALIDMMPGPDGAGFAAHPGGAALNLARSAARLGLRSALFCPISRDLFGEQLIEAMRASGVERGFAPRVEAPCPLAFVQRQGGENRFAFYDTGSALHAEIARPAPLPAEVLALAFGGISLIGEPFGRNLEALASREAGRRLILIDPNIRPGFVRDAGAYRARLGRMIARADIVKVSDEDLGWLWPGLAAEAAAEAFLAAGPAAVLLTRGGESASLHHAGGVLRQPVTPVPAGELKDTVGAGDAFSAGFLAGLARDGRLSRAAFRAAGPEALKAALELAVRLGSASVRRHGAAPPEPAEVAGLLG